MKTEELVSAKCLSFLNYSVIVVLLHQVSLHFMFCIDRLPCVGYFVLCLMFLAKTVIRRVSREGRELTASSKASLFADPLAFFPGLLY